MSGVLYYGDNLPVLRKWVDDESVDLIYLDPPFNSKSDYNTFFRSKAQEVVFKDYWEWDDAADAAFREIIGAGSTAPRALVSLIDALGRVLDRNKDLLAYLSMMALRLVELRRVLKPTGSMYLHCDPTASHYLKLVLDAIFGQDNFQNEIVWKRTTAHNSAKRYGPVHDVMLFYSKSAGGATWNPQPQPYDSGYLSTKYRHVDPSTGQRYRLSDLTGAGIRNGESGKAWRGHNPTLGGRHWAVPRHGIESLRAKGIAIPGGPLEQLELLFEHGLIRFPQKKDGTSGVPEYKRYLEGMKGVALQDVWDDIDALNSMAKERTIYPTQKPLGLLARLIESSSNKGDVVLDPFCGCGTTIEACEKLGREWIGIDVAPPAVQIIRDRLEKIGVTDLKVIGWPMDLDGAKMLEKDDKIGFQRWAVFMAGGRLPDGRQYSGGADGGIDGELLFDDGGRKLRALISVKGGGVGANDIRVLRDVVASTRAEAGIFLSMLEPTKAMRDLARESGFFTDANGKEHRRIQLYTAEQLLKRDPRLFDLPGQNVTPDSTRPGVRKGQTIPLPFGAATKKKKRGAR